MTSLLYAPSPMRILARSGTAGSAITGSTNEIVAATVVLPAMGTASQVWVRFGCTCTSSANNKSFRIRLGATGNVGSTVSGGSVISSIGSVTTNSFMRFDSMIYMRGATNSQYAEYFSNRTTDTLQFGGTATSAVDMSSSVNLVITVQSAASGDSFTLDAYSVILFP